MILYLFVAKIKRCGSDRTNFVHLATSWHSRTTLSSCETSKTLSGTRGFSSNMLHVQHTPTIRVLEDDTKVKLLESHNPTYPSPLMHHPTSNTASFFGIQPTIASSIPGSWTGTATSFHPSNTSLLSHTASRSHSISSWLLACIFRFPPSRPRPVFAPLPWPVESYDP